jgi:flavin reductase (DIM6/NTAB) family NADH-FMN oxidoreductase RutF
MKKNLGPVNALYPSLTVILGAVVNGKPNFLAVAHVGIMNHGTPQYLSFGLGKVHYTNQGIHEHKEFSVNIPSENLMVETDYVGIVTGKNTDKSTLFDLFHGELKHAPMIKQCPVTMECRLHSVVDFSTHEVFIGEIAATHADPLVLDAKGKIDGAKVKPLLFEMSSLSYYSLGQPLGKCWSVGKQLKHKNA